MFQRSSTAILILVFCLVLAISTFASANMGIPGGFAHNKPTAKRAARFSKFLSKKLADKYTITQILDVETQVVAGFIYRVTALVKDVHGEEKRIKVRIFEPLPNSIEAGQEKLRLKDIQEF